jgi:hypothetical protein
VLEENSISKVVEQSSREIAAKLLGVVMDWKNVNFTGLCILNSLHAFSKTFVWWQLVILPCDKSSPHSWYISHHTAGSVGMYLLIGFGSLVDCLFKFLCCENHQESPIGGP